MSDKPISVGDLVQVVRTDCKKSADLALGKIGRVDSIGVLPARFGPFCEFCKQRYAVSELATVQGWYPPLSWLKRIPPLSELEGEKRDEEIHA